MSTPETTYYQDGNITVTNARAVLGAKTYAMANITSVSMGVIPANTSTGTTTALIGLIASGGCLMLAFAGMGGDAVGGIVIGLILLAVGVASVKAAKTQYVVKIGSASGESNALSSTDRAYIQTIVNAINKSIIKRG